jgi:hypothetical protein
MVSLFAFFALVGGTILVCQFVLTLVGLGTDHADFGGMHDADAGSGFADLHHDVASPEGHDAGGHHGSTWLFGIVSFRTLVAAATFFGLGGLVAESLRQSPVVQVGVALACGAAAMYAVHGVMRLFGNLAEDGTVRIRRAIGEEATVYLSIPPQRSGVGKVHLSLQQRLMEYPAVTAGDVRLAVGAKVRVTGVVGTNTLEVELSGEQREAA